MPRIEDRPATRQWSRRALLALWLASGVTLLLFIGGLSVSRTQEARVLETARQMLGSGASGWLTPQLNEEPRLAKPPLCYWMTAVAYRITGQVSETVGRIPTALLGLLTLGVTFAFARRLFDHDVAVASCAAMLGSLLFFKHMRLAETDAPATLFVTLAVYAIWRAAESAQPNFGWLHVAGASIGLAAMAKGGPAAFGVLFLVGFAMVQRRWDLLKRFVTTGAFLTALLVGAWWYLFIIKTKGYERFLFEVRTAATGRDHFDWPYVYIPALFVAVAPWCGVLPLALVDATQQWKAEPRMRVLVIWTTSILLPLCIIGNKQPHYLLPLIPPLMIMIGQTLVRRPSWLKPVMIATAGIVIAGGLVAPLIASRLRGHVDPVDWVLPAAMVGLLIGILLRKSVQPILYAMPLVLLLTLGVWLPTTQPTSSRSVAREIRQQFGDGPYLFAGTNLSLPLCFNLRSTIPVCETTDELLQRARPGTIAIAQTKNNTTPPTLPTEFVHVLSVQGTEDHKFDLYRYQPSAATTLP